MEDLPAEHYRSYIGLITAILLFLAAVAPIAQGLWSAFSKAEEKSRVVLSIFNWLSTIFFFASALVVLLMGPGILSLSVAGLGWVFLVIVYILDDQHQKARILLVIVGAVGIAFLIQLQLTANIIMHLFERVEMH